MIRWRDEGILLAARRHGESGAVVQVLTREHGRHAGLLRGGGGKRRRGELQPGNDVVVEWQARLAEHLGTWNLDVVRPRAAALMADPRALAGLTAACALAELTLPERQPQPAVHDGLHVLLEALTDMPDWPVLLVRWELGLLQALGFGLDLSRCAVTGGETDLVFVSPRSGRAVSRAGAGRYADRLLPLPAFLRGEAGAPTDRQAVREGFALTGHFLEARLLAPEKRGLPPARQRLLERLE